MDSTTIGVLATIGIMIGIGVAYLKWKDHRDLRPDMTPDERDLVVTARTEGTVGTVHNVRGAVIGIMLIAAGGTAIFSDHPVWGFLMVLGGAGILWMVTDR